MKKPRKISAIILEDRMCRHSVLWGLLRATAQKQADHNLDMESKYSGSGNHRDALMQQQFRHGILFVMDLMRQFEQMHEVDKTLLFMYPFSPVPKGRCMVSTQVGAAMEALRSAVGPVEPSKKPGKEKRAGV